MNKIIERIRELVPVMDEASSRRLVLRRGLMGGNLGIADYFRMHDEGDLAYVLQERLERRGDRDDAGYRTIPIKTAAADAKALVDAFNCVRELIDLATAEGGLDEVAWLIEFPADRHAPIRYYSAGERPVMNAAEATRFARKKDADAIIKAMDLKRGKAVDHKWVAAVPSEAE